MSLYIDKSINLNPNKRAAYNNKGYNYLIVG